MDQNNDQERNITMKPMQLVLRCYGEKKGEVWQAFCIDLNLAVQGDSERDVRLKLNQQVASYLYDALEGEDRKYAAQLLNRKAPLAFRAKYYFYKALNAAAAASDGIKDHVFSVVMPLTLPHDQRHI
jgi:hypothetical protein